MIKQKVILKKTVLFNMVMAFLCSIIISTSVIYAEELSDKSKALVVEGQEADQEKNKDQKQQRWALFPIIASTTETGLMLGGMAFYFFPSEEPKQQTSTVDFMVYGTTKGQCALTLTPNIYFGDGLYRLSTNFSADYWKANYYQTGNFKKQVLCSQDIHEAKRFGCKITKFHKGVIFRGKIKNDFADFAKTFYDM